MATKPASAWSIRQGDGYPALAEVLANDGDSEALVYRKFQTLASRSLLHLQGELIKLEDDLYSMDQEAANSLDHGLHMSMRSWAAFEERSRKPDRKHERARQEKFRQIEELLQRYYEALLRQRKIAMLETPSERVLSSLRLWLHGETRKANGDSKLDGSDKLMFDNQFDLVALRPPLDQDVLSRFLRDHWPPEKSESSPMAYISLRRISWLATAMSVVLAAVLLACPIVVLYFVTNPNARLALVVAFILLFALGLSIATGANRDSVFAATAAYAAVLVVFVSGDLANSS